MSQFLVNRPIPGQSLTQDPNNKLPYEMPPQQVELNEALGDILDDLTSRRKLPFVTRALKKNSLYVDRIVSGYIEEGLIAGRWNTDLAHLLVEPMMFMFMWIASQVDAPIRFRGHDLYDSSGMDVLGSKAAEKAVQAGASLLAPTEEISDGR